MEFHGSSTIQRISVFGLGKLGSAIAGCHASRGFRVIGVDVNERYVEACNHGLPPVQEPGLEPLYESCGNLLTARTDGVSAVRESEATLIVVPTPSEPDGGYSLEYVLQTCNTIGEGLQEKESYHLIVLKSTVLPGSCDGYVVPILEARSRKRCGVDFGFCYNPEFIALGSVVHDIFHPDLTLVGESDSTAGDHLVEIYGRLLGVQCPMARMNIVNAEMAKLAINSYVTMKITFANLLARICGLLPGADVDAVTAALGLDSRIGPKYLRGGLGYGGPCFPRDNRAIACLARRLGVSFPLAEATDEANRKLADHVAEVVASKVEPGSRIGILGLSYKPSTPVIEESQGIIIAKILVDRGFEIVAYDPLAMEAARSALGESIHYAESVHACISEADLVLITTPWDEFKKLDFLPLNGRKPPTVIDCWGILKMTEGSASVLRLGKNYPQSVANRNLRPNELADDLEG